MRQRDFQRKVFERLERGHSVLVVAPTGLGKTRAALEPFLRKFGDKSILGKRLIYALPLRALAKGVVEEFLELKASFQPVVHHGDEPESKFFSEPAIITTIDQYFTAFAGAPLSWASHLSHSVAGAVLTSYSVFDEVHLLSPQKGLQLLFAVLYLRKRWGLLSCVMTATLPPSVIKFFKDFCELEVVKASEDDIKERDEWRHVEIELAGKPVTLNSKTKRETTPRNFEWEEKNPSELAQFVIDKWNQWEELEINGPRKIIVFVNTVDRAIKVYHEIENNPEIKNRGVKVLLAHSRFTKEDRKEIEEKLRKLFGKNSNSEEAILITTQVAEAGLNISAPLVVTELCPMDSLIQRAGRCQRFKQSNEAKGKILVVKPRDGEAPYYDKVRVIKEGDKLYISDIFPALDFTQLTLEIKAKDKLKLTWDEEEKLIKQALDKLYQTYIEGLTDVRFKQGEKFFETLYNRNSKKKETQEEEENRE